MSEPIWEGRATRILMNLPGMEKIQTPRITDVDRQSAGTIFSKWAPLIAELGVEQIASGIATGDKYGLEVLKILRPAIFQNQATVVEVKSTSGSIDPGTAKSLADLLSQREAANLN